MTMSVKQLGGRQTMYFAGDPKTALWDVVSGSSNTLIEFQVHSLAGADLPPSSEVLHSLSLATGNEIEDRSHATFRNANQGPCYASFSVASLEGLEMSRWN